MNKPGKKPKPRKRTVALQDLPAKNAGTVKGGGAVGDDAQLANIDLQNNMQKQQQTIQMLSNVSRTVQDTAMSTVRKIGG